MREVKRPAHNCAERVFSGDRMDTLGHMCGIPATVREGGKMWCWRHTQAGQERQERISDERVDAYLADSRLRAEVFVETQRRSRLFPDVLKALKAAVEHADRWHGEGQAGEGRRCTDCIEFQTQTRAVIKEAGKK